MQIKLYLSSKSAQLRNFNRKIAKNRIKLCLFGLMALMSCKSNKVPDNIIEQNKMVKVLVDMHIADAVLSRVRNQDTMLMMASSKYYYIFKKYDIDSAKFTQSLKYYNYQPELFTKIYTAVLDSLKAKIPKDIPVKKKPLSKIKKPLPVKNDLPR
jgi:DNA-directed RNA polymerase subunit H (RpoH/RPB5)